MEDGRSPSHPAPLPTDTPVERGSPSAWLSEVYDQLRTLADQYLRAERPGHTLQATALVHEAFLRLTQQDPARFNDREHFFRTAAVAMRRILVNHARDRRALKRGGDSPRVPLDSAVAMLEERSLDLIALDEALQKLAELDPCQAQVVELRFFGGLDVNDTAAILGISPRTVVADWGLAKAWLLREVTKGATSAALPLDAPGASSPKDHRT